MCIRDRVVAMIAINARATYGAKISVDEPQYLLTALSIAEDFDLDISDELDERRYLPFHELRLNQQTIDLNDSGQRISPHDPLLPILLALPMGLSGWLASKIALAVLAAITAAAATVAATVNKTASANETLNTTGSGYQKTKHVKTYYETARF